MRKTFKQFVTCDMLQFVQRIGNNCRYKKSPQLTRFVARERIGIALNILRARSYVEVAPLKAEAWVTDEPIPFADRQSGRHIADIAIGDKWAEKVFDCAWFKFSGAIPAEYVGKEIVYVLNTGGEGLVYDIDGDIKQSITCYASDYSYVLGLPVKRIVQHFCGNNVIFWVDAGANDLFGKFKKNARLQEAHIAYCNPNIRALAYDIEVLMSRYDLSAKDDRLDDLFKSVKDVAAIANKITEEQAANCRKALSPFLNDSNDDGQFEYLAVGHAHLDLAWLWPIRESKRKGARTFGTQLHNISRYPDYIFGASQAQLYQWIKDGYPDIYDRVKAAANTPNWDVQGATWVEMDSNLIGGESMIRQFYYGKKFFRKEFDQDMKILWLPDSFGYSACLPQVMKLADVPYFLTQKISWNTVNKFPHHTFLWDGLDGTRIFAHMLPDDTYNSPVRGDRMKFGERNYQERKISDKAMMLFGIGDGGAGPGYEHIERMERQSNLLGLPKVTPMKALDSFMALDNREISYPIYSGELYLERHQGTYTTQSKNKKYNRKSEFLLRNYEIFAAEAIVRVIDLPISIAELDDIWKEILLYQFHDILPGSSINRVYEESVARYEIIMNRLNIAIDLLSSQLYGKGLFNPNSYNYNKAIKVGDKWYTVNMPKVGFISQDDMQLIDKFAVAVGKDYIENDKLQVTFKNGVIIELFDKATGINIIPTGKEMGLFTHYRDCGDCWDIRPVNYHSTRKAAKFLGWEILTDGAKAIANVKFSIGNSSIDCQYCLIQGSSSLDISISIDCHQESGMIRCEFPVDIISDECKFNTQFGHVIRKTTENNSIEKAQYEVSGQKFVDISNADYGVSLINDCKYGYRCKGNVIDINLVRSPMGGPGHDVDQGINTLKLAVLPHIGALSSDTYSEAYYINNPPIIIGGNTSTDSIQLFNCDNDNIILEAVKVSDDGRGVILHVYNSSESKQTAHISYSNYRLEGLTNVMEDSLTEVNEGLQLSPFQLVMLKFVK